MEIRINIDETRFKDIVENELKALSSEEIQQVIKAAIKEYLVSGEVLREFLTAKPYYGEDRITTLMKGVDLSDVYAEPKKLVLDYLKNDEVIAGVARELVANVFRERTKSALTMDWDFCNQVANMVAQMLMQRQQ